MNVFSVSTSNNKVELPLSNHNQNTRQIHEHNETSLMDNVNTNSILLTSSSPKQTYHLIPNIKMNTYPRTIENLNKRQTIIRNKLNAIKHQLVIHLKEESFIARHSLNKSIDHLNLISTAIREFVHQGQRRLRTMYEEQKLIFEFDRNDLHLVKSFYDLNPNKKQLLNVQKLWRSKVKACKRAIREYHNNSSLPHEPNTEVNNEGGNNTLE
ncbi:unnamed protein product, partial [Rotaria magnacalcarata]